MNKYIKEYYNNNDYKDWDPADVELHKSIDWKARDYKDYPVVKDSFEYPAIGYSDDGTKTEKIKFIKYLRSNPIFPPYYAPEKNPFPELLGPMYDGERYGFYDIHNRYESQHIYDLLSESVEVADIVYDINTLDYENGQLKSSNIEHYDTYNDEDEARDMYKRLASESFYPHVELVKVYIMEDGSYKYKTLERTYDLNELEINDDEVFEEDYNDSNVDLPTDFTIKLTDADIAEIIDSDDEGEFISDIITNYFGQAHNGFNYQLDFDNYKIYIANVNWDYDDEEYLNESGIKHFIEDVIEEIEAAGGKENYLEKINGEIKAKIEEIDTLEYQLKNLNRPGYGYNSIDDKELEYDIQQAEADLKFLFDKKNIAEQGE